MSSLNTLEEFWRDKHVWLLSCGYQLRPRLRTGWIPSWVTNPPKRGGRHAFKEREDSLSIISCAIDATRLVDGKDVMLKSVWTKLPGTSGYETDIASYVSMSALMDDPDNHCVPTYEVLRHPDDDTFDILVMPLLRPFDSPRFETVGEGADFFLQAFKGLRFLHRHRIAHRDCTGPNIMMDCGDMYPHGWHPISPDHNKEYTAASNQAYTRTQRPPKYLWIDFGLSAHFKDPDHPPIFFRSPGTDKSVPEFKARYADTTPFDPFATDIYYLGNLIRIYFLDGDTFQPSMKGFEFMRPLVNDMINDDPEERPDIDECVARLEDTISSISTWKLRSQVVYSTDWIYGYIWRLLPYLARLLYYFLLDVPAIPSR